MSHDVFEIIEDRLDTYRAELFDLLRQPSISSQSVGVEDCADLLRTTLERYGFQATVVETSTYPIVVGERQVDPDAPTVLFYGHYDVQPPGPEDEWDSPPFEPTVRDGSIYARGAGDNKGQLLAHVFAVDAMRRARGELPVNVTLLADGEEESGSAGLVEYVERSPPTLSCDLCLVADGPMHRSRRPTLIFGNRGILAVELALTRANADLHSGNFGGPVPNAATDLVRAIASMADDDGRVAIDGFHDDVAITDAQRAAVREIPLDPAGLKADLGLDAFAVPDQVYYERLLCAPALSVNGIHAGYGGPGMKTIIPREATAKVDLRLVPDQEPDHIFELVRDHVTRVCSGISVERLGSFPPLATPMDTPAANPVRAALESAWDASVVEQPLLGGSLPAAYLGRTVKAPILVVPYANPDQNNHAPNEHLDLDCLENGIRTSAGVIERLPAIAD